MEKKKILLTDLDPNTGQVEGLPANPREWLKRDVRSLADSMRDTPELVEARGLIVYPYAGRYVIIGGNMRYEAAKLLHWKDIDCVVLPEDTTAGKLKEILLKDNSTFGVWQFKKLKEDFGEFEFQDLGIKFPDDWVEEEMTDEEYEEKKKEFESRIKAGELSEESEEYREFVEKFEAKKTTDDCYTPEVVYEAVADWVAQTYSLNRKNFVRPFYPGGDYRAEKYKTSDVVVDNPPFSILAEILRYYDTNRVKFFLFAPALTLFSSSSSSSCTALSVGYNVTYANGADVCTSFLTNLEPSGCRLRSAPTLYAVIKQANETNLKSIKKQLPKYSYDHHVITAAFINTLSRLGVDFAVPVDQSVGIDQLDSQRESGKAIFGKGYLVGDKVWAERETAEREKAEREKAEREKAERWELSPRELEIVKSLTP